jgi:hypothetical protein
MATCEEDACCALAGKKNYMTLDQVILGFATFLIFQKLMVPKSHHCYIFTKR